MTWAGVAERTTARRTRCLRRCRSYASAITPIGVPTIQARSRISQPTCRKIQPPPEGSSYDPASSGTFISRGRLQPAPVAEVAEHPAEQDDHRAGDDPERVDGP